jgi:hypothetical protein
MVDEIELLRRQAAIAALPACIAESFRLEAQISIGSSVGEVLDRAAVWAEWSAEKLIKHLKLGS